MFLIALVSKTKCLGFGIIAIVEKRKCINMTFMFQTGCVGV